MAAEASDNQNQFAADWVNRTGFKTQYDALSNTDYVNKLYANAGVVPPMPEKAALVSALDTAAKTRAAVLLAVANNATFQQQERTRRLC